MRKRQEVEKNADETAKIDRIILEILLDIRELLTKK